MWYINSADGEYAAGWLVGRSDNSVAPYNMSLSTLQFTEGFGNRYVQLDFHDNGNGTTPVGSIYSRSDGTLQFIAGAQSFTFKDDANISTVFPNSSLNAGASNSSLAVYDIVGAGSTPYRLTLLKPGSGNPTIALNYVSFGHWQQLQNGATDASDRWFAWGRSHQQLPDPDRNGPL